MEFTVHGEVPWQPCQFEAGSAMGIYGPSRAGKSTWIEQLLKHKDVMFSEVPNKVLLLYCYSIQTQKCESLQIKFRTVRSKLVYPVWMIYTSLETGLTIYLYWIPS